MKAEYVIFIKNAIEQLLKVVEVFIRLRKELDQLRQQPGRHENISELNHLITTFDDGLEVAATYNGEGIVGVRKSLDEDIENYGIQ